MCSGEGWGGEIRILLRGMVSSDLIEWQLLIWYVAFYSCARGAMHPPYPLGYGFSLVFLSVNDNFYFCSFYLLKGWERARMRVRARAWERFSPLVHSSDPWNCVTEGRIQELRLSPPGEWQGPEYLSYQLLSPQVNMNTNLKLEIAGTWTLGHGTPMTHVVSQSFYKNWVQQDFWKISTSWKFGFFYMW